LFCLLWDVPENQRNRIIRALHDRSLVKFHIDGYYLHPVIRIEAIERLKSIEEIEAKKLLLVTELPELEEDWDKFDDEEWMEEQSLLKESLWIIKGKDWIEMLTENIIIYRNIILNSPLSEEEIQLLDEYYDTNKMLVDCLNSSFEVSDKVQTYLEKTLFITINEINKLTIEN